MGEVSYYDAVKAGELLDLEPTLKKNLRYISAIKMLFNISRNILIKNREKGIYGFGQPKII